MYVGDLNIVEALGLFSGDSFGLGMFAGGMLSVGAVLVWVILSRYCLV